MTLAPESAAPRSRAPLSLAIWIFALALGAVAALWIPVHAPVPGAFSDSVDYLVFADWLRDRMEGAPAADWFYLQTRYPPLFPLALAAVGAGISHAAAAAWLTSALLVLGWLLASAWLARDCGVRAGLLLAVPLVLNPGWLLAVLNPLSEPMFLCLLILALLQGQRVRDDGAGLAVFAAIVSLAPLCRMAGFALVLAAAAWLTIRRPAPWPRLAAATVAMAAPGLLWSWVRGQYPVVAAYSTDLVAALGAPGAGLAHLRQLVAAGVVLFDPRAGGAGSPLLIALPPFFAGLALRLRERRLDALILLVYGGLVAVWPYPAESPRLLLVILPLLLVCTWQGLTWGIARFTPASATVAASVVAGGLVAAGLPFLVTAGSRAAMPVDAALLAAKRDARYLRARSDAEAAQILEIRGRSDLAMDQTWAALPPGECVYTFFPQTLYAHAPGVTAVPMPYPRIPGMPLLEQFSRCRYVFVTNTPSAQVGEPALYPLPEAASSTEPVFASFMEVNSRQILVAALLRLRDPPQPR